MFNPEMILSIWDNPRTFEEHRFNLLDQLENRCRNTQLGMFPNDLWSSEINNWIANSRLKWHDDMSRLRRNFFSLEDPFLTGAIAVPSPGQAADADVKNGSHLSIRNAFDMSKDLYELGEDGKMHFKLRFEAADYSPEDIQVTSIGNRLIVKAKSEKKTPTSSSYKEFLRTVELPDKIEHGNFTCHLTKDGVLEIDAPVRAPDYEAIGFSEGELGIKPKQIAAAGTGSGALSNEAAAPQQHLAVLNKPGPVVLPTTDGATGKKIHLELPIEADYQPSDIHVRADGNKIYIKGRHEAASEAGASLKEFSKYYEIPESPDPLSVTAGLIDNMLVVEAPLKFSG